MSVDQAEVDRDARVERCPECGAAVWRARFVDRAPRVFDVYGRERTAVPHNSTCQAERAVAEC